MAVSANGGASVAAAAPYGNGIGEEDRSGTSSTGGGFVPLVCVVDFHHARGPEVERWFGASEGFDPAVSYDWSLLPFMALSDGAHASTEDFSYFTLLRPGGAGGTQAATSLFGVSCTRQMDASQLLSRPSDVTRSTVQKAVVVIADSPRSFGMLRERLSVVTKAWFAQREFSDVEILRRFQESLAEEKRRGVGVLDSNDAGAGAGAGDGADDRHLGLSLRELVKEFRWQTLVLFKCCLLQPKMLFFGSRCERLCLMQFSLISLIPGLLGSLQDCAGPELNNYERKLTRPTGVRTSDRNSLLAYMGLPLQIFGKGSLFGPYTPLQQLDLLADFGTKSYIVGSTNSLLLQQRDRYSDILINLDEGTINVTSTSLKAALHLSSADRRWIESITAEVNETWDDANPGRPKGMGYRGSEESIRLQFQDYILSLLAAVKYRNYTARRGPLPHIEGDPSADFNPDWIDHWARTDNYRIWDAHTDSALFDINDPKHPCAGGGLGRIAQQMQELGLDERFAAAGVVVGKGVAAGREKASAVFNKLYADVEAMREAQRKRAEESRLQQQQQTQNHPHQQHRHSLQQGGGGGERNGGGRGGGTHGGHERNGSFVPAVDFAKAGQAAQAVGSKAGAFASSWAAWAGEKRKAWGRSSSSSNNSNNSANSTLLSGNNSTSSTPTSATTPTVGGWSSLVGRSSKRNTSSSFASTTTLSSSDAGGGPASSTYYNDKDDVASVVSSQGYIHPLRSPIAAADASQQPVSPLAERRPLSPSSSAGGSPAVHQGAAAAAAPGGIDSVLAGSGGVTIVPSSSGGGGTVSLPPFVPPVRAAVEEEDEEEKKPRFPVIETENVWAGDRYDEIPSPIVERKRTPEPAVPAPVGSKIVLRP